ncbi:regulatory Fis family protein [Sphingomonas sp. PP-CE-3G-477]|uniref:helix-turn-helix domain-containing protein n=1 Tax=Sphingomonas sp. PP-CE-3G-477 TaxID=2135660 RepID=UPI000D47AE94|nr:helix-turn-helix domain-containing protein [Sphingomonas sp. PP-CE-3G-477]PTQ58828.1 regulatory Fis family protein [Sphingomonas sp. PP-CE-3G-477]
MPHHAAYALADLPLGRTAPEAEAASVNDLDRGERQAIEQALKKHAFNISTAATELELSRGTPYRRMEKHGL